ncbi:HTH-type transcriptional regulator BhcR [Silicimonas sp. MF1-12-2]|uniref:HTH-type transcriptional regulator BhcR n=1 Tax=Silicimonas sp. MF1-12-2 TaxID=3384793 RepID=UPI0039B58A6F
MDGFPDSSPRRGRGRPRDWHDKTEQNTIKSLDRAMEVFEHLSTIEGATLSEISGALDQSPATVYRILVTLESRGLVEFDGAEQLWQIGARAFVIGARYLRRTSLVERARPILRRLMEETGETANLGIGRGTEVLFVSQVETHESIRAFFPPGTLSPLHASGIGKALLARMDEAALNRFLARAHLQRFTEHTICERGALLSEMEAIRSRGYSIDDEEKTLGMRCVAAAVIDMHGEAIAGLSISGPTSRVTGERIQRFGTSVAGAARELSAAMGAVDP